MDNCFIDLFEELCLNGHRGEHIVERIYREKREFIEREINFKTVREDVRKKLDKLEKYCIDN